jgi:flagellar hook-length control protein FliK
MSKPIFMTDLGIISPKTVTPAASKPVADMSLSADAFEGALSTAVARQRENKARAQQDDRSKKADQSTGDATSTSAAQKSANAANADKPDADKPDAGKPDAGKKAAAPAKAAPQAEKKSSAPETAGQAAAVEASTNAGVAKIDADGAMGDGSADGAAPKEDQQAAVDAQTAVMVAQSPIASALPPAPALSDAETAAILPAQAEGATSIAPPLAPGLAPGLAPAPVLTPTSPASDQAGAAAPLAQPPVQPDAATDALTAAAPAPDAAPAVTLAPSGAAPQAQTQTLEAPTPAPQTFATPAPQATPAQAAADQALAAQIAAEAALTQAALMQASAQQSAAAPTTPSAQPSTPPAAKPFIPVESSSFASLNDAIDMPTTVTYTASNSSQSQNGGSAGFGAQSGFNFGSGGNAGGSAAGSAATPAIVTQDLALLNQTVASDAEALPAAAPMAVVASASEDAPLVDVRPATAQSSPVVQTAATHTVFEAPTAQNALPAPRAHQVLLPLASQITAGMTALAKNGGGEINIHLQPANLGRVDVSMKIDEDGRMTATITADRQDTLDLLRRDSYALERSLADAGMKTDGGGLQFSLRGESGQRDRDGGDGRAPRGLAQIAPDQEATQASPLRRTSGLSRLDMRI